ncbi:hypothetical protein G159_05465 [Planococcus glaciei CHR43]|nr:hypothetical protein G159_05465 [Planococcus glaciei CHR43]
MVPLFPFSCISQTQNLQEKLFNADGKQEKERNRKKGGKAMRMSCMGSIIISIVLSIILTVLINLLFL